MSFIPKTPSGYVPGNEFVSTGEPFGLKVGVITRVDEVEMKADIKVLTGGGDRFEVDLTQAQVGPRSFWGGVPEIHSLVVIGYRRRHKQLHEAMILGYLPVGHRLGTRFDPRSVDDPGSVSPDEQDLYEGLFGKPVRYKRLKLSPGDVGGMSSAGAELVLSKDVRMCDRAGDLLELRDAERTLVSQSIHKVSSEAGVFRVSGPVRRGAFYLPPDILSEGSKALKGTEERYFGRSTLKRFTNAAGTLFDTFNNRTAYPPVVYSNARQVHYPATMPGVNFEDPETGAGAEVFTESRLEIAHSTDLTQEVREEIDGFQMDRKPTYIEQVLGTVIGNDSSSETGMQQYGQLLKPHLFEDFKSTKAGLFELQSVPRNPTEDIEAFSTAGAYLFRINPPAPPPARAESTSVFAVAVSKQGKLFVNVPGSKVEDYASGTTNVSAEVNMDGALKMRLGAARPDNIALHLTLDGGAVFDFKGSGSGQGLTFRTHSSLVWTCQGVPDEDNVAWSEDIQGVRRSSSAGDSIENVGGAKVTTVNGGFSVLADRFSVNATSGVGVNAGSLDCVVAGKSQYQYAEKVVETVVTGGKKLTLLAGDLEENLTAGSRKTTVLAGGVETNLTAGDYKVTVGAGGITLTAGTGNIVTNAGVGAVNTNSGSSISFTAALAINLNSLFAVALNSPQVLLGASVAPFGVCRGTPSLPPGSPSLDWITGLPLQGSAVIRSL